MTPFKLLRFLIRIVQKLPLATDKNLKSMHSEKENTKTNFFKWFWNVNPLALFFKKNLQHINNWVEREQFAIKTSIYTAIVLLFVYILLEIFFDKSILASLQDSLISLVNGIAALIQAINKFFSDLVQFRDTIEMLKDQAQLREQLDTLLQVKPQESFFRRGFDAFLNMISNLCGRFLWFSAQIGNAFVGGIDIFKNWVIYTGDFFYERTPGAAYQIFKVLRSFLILACFCAFFHGFANIPILSTRIPFLVQLDKIFFTPVFDKTYLILTWLRSPTFFPPRESLIDAIKNSVEKYSLGMITPLSTAVSQLERTTTQNIIAQDKLIGNLAKNIGNLQLTVQTLSYTNQTQLGTIFAILSGATVSATLLSKNTETILILKDVILQFCDILQVSSQSLDQNDYQVQEKLSSLIDSTRQKLDPMTPQSLSSAENESIQENQMEIADQLNNIQQLRILVEDTYQRITSEINLRNQSLTSVESALDFQPNPTSSVIRGLSEVEEDGTL
jgi:hypothetical protein